MHVRQLPAVLAVTHQQLPGHGRLHAFLDAVASGFEGVVAQPLLDHRIPHQRRQQCQAHGHRPAAGQMDRAQAGPEQHGAQGVAEESRDHPPGEILGQVLGAFGHVRLEHDEDDALGELLAVDQEVTEGRQRGQPEQQAEPARDATGALGKEQHGDQPQAAEQEGLAKTAETAGAGDLDQQLGDTREIPEEQEEPAQAGPVERPLLGLVYIETHKDPPQVEP
ncbi:hypothetical protein D9M68_651790 [compost metagenome]